MVVSVWVFDMTCLPWRRRCCGCALQRAMGKDKTKTKTKTPKKDKKDKVWRVAATGCACVRSLALGPASEVVQEEQDAQEGRH